MIKKPIQSFIYCELTDKSKSYPLSLYLLLKLFYCYCMVFSIMATMSTDPMNTITPIITAVPPPSTPCYHHRLTVPETEVYVPLYDEVKVDSIINSVIRYNNIQLYTSELINFILFYFIEDWRVNSLITKVVGCCLYESHTRY